MGKYYNMLMQDVRMREGLTSCMNCGVCTGVCPSAEFYNYDPRQIVSLVQSKDDEVIEKLLKSETLWYCGECMSCRPRCPRGNTPGYVIQALRTLSQKLGFFVESEKGRQQLALKRVIGENILSEGYCLQPRMVDPDLHPEQGPVWRWIIENDWLEAIVALPEQLFIHNTRSLGHQARGVFHFRECNHLTYIVLIRHQHNQTIQSVTQSYMGRHTVPECIKQKSKSFIGIFSIKSKNFKHFFLDIVLMNTNRTASQFKTVQNDIIGIGTDFLRFCIHKLNIFFHRHRKRMMHCRITSLFFRILQKRKFGNPKEMIIIFIK